MIALWLVLGVLVVLAVAAVVMARWDVSHHTGHPAEWDEPTWQKEAA